MRKNKISTVVKFFVNEKKKIYNVKNSVTRDECSVRVVLISCEDDDDERELSYVEFGGKLIVGELFKIKF